MTHTDEPNEYSSLLTDLYNSRESGHSVSDKENREISDKAERLNFIGWPDKNHYDLAWIGKLSRSEGLELMHFIYLSKDGTVQLHSAVSALLPFEKFRSDSCLAYNPERVLKTAEIMATERIFILCSTAGNLSADRKRYRTLAISGRKEFADLFGGIIIPGDGKYLIFNGTDSFKVRPLIDTEDPESKNHSEEEMALSTFLDIFEPEQHITIHLGLNKEERIVFWTFCKENYPQWYYSPIIKALGGVKELLVENNPDRIRQIGDQVGVWEPE